MKLQVELPDEIAAELIVLARRASVAPEDIIAETLREVLPYLRKRLPHKDAAA